MDFLFIASDYKPLPGGIAEYIDNLARGLATIGKRIRILAVIGFEEVERKKFLENYEEWVIPFPVVHDRRPENWVGSKGVSLLEILRVLLPASRKYLGKTSLFRSSAHSVLKLLEIINEDRPEMIIFGHLDYRLYPLALSLAEEKLPYGVIAHDYEVNRNNIFKVNDIVKRGMILRGAKWLAANSKHTKSLLKMWGIANEKILILPPAISEEILREAASSTVREGGAGFNLLTICRLARSKGIDIVFRALKILNRKGIPFQYYIAGEGEEREVLEGMLNELAIADKVKFLGHVSEERKWDCFRKADVLVMPSRVNPRLSHEGFGLAFIEAAAFGVPRLGPGLEEFLMR